MTARIGLALLGLVLVLAAVASAASVRELNATHLVTTVSRNGTTYDAVSQNGLPNYSGSLKSVVESAASDQNSAGGGTISFEAGLFEFGFNEWFELDGLTDIVFEGQGIDVTTIENFSEAKKDTEPFDFSPPTARITIRDMTISAGGPRRSTSDAIDADGGNDFLIERVKITSSRGRGIIFDGKDAGQSADRNQIRDCVITGVLGAGIEFLASNDNIVTGCNIANVPGAGIKINKSSSVADQPNKKSNNNQILDNTISNAGGDGIRINSSDFNQITGNIISNSSVDGISIKSNNSITCDDNVVDGNTSTDNGRYGLNIASSKCQDNIVSANTFQNNGSRDINDSGTNTQFTGGTPTPTPAPTPTPTPAIHDTGKAGGGFRTPGQTDFSRTGGGPQFVVVQIKNFGTEAENSVPWQVTIKCDTVKDPNGLCGDGTATGGANLSGCTSDAAPLNPGRVKQESSAKTPTCTVTYLAPNGTQDSYLLTLIVGHCGGVGDPGNQLPGQCAVNDTGTDANVSNNTAIKNAKVVP